MKLLGLVLAIALFGCEETNSHYCKGNPDNNCAETGGDGGGGGGGGACSSSSQCSGGTPVCDTTSSTCVQCTADSNDLCTTATPVCGSNDECRGCQMHAECASTACLPTGACGSDANVAYVKPGASNAADTNNCTLESPCATITRALTIGLPYIKVTGTVVDNVTIAQDVTILADPNAMLTPKSPAALVTISGSSPTVEIDDLELTGASSSSGHGIVIGTGVTPTLTVQRVTISGNAGIGISASGGTIIVKRTTVYGNTGGGVYLNFTSWDFENDIIAANGSPTSNYGGIEFDQDATTAPHIFDFNTVSKNDSNASSGNGVACIALSTTYTFSDDIVWNDSSSELKTGGDCNFSYSDIGPNVAATATNIAGDPGLDSKFHIPHGSVAMDAADPSANEAVDIDGTARPIGARRDMGAFETQ